jgi:hypothetical protein
LEFVKNLENAGRLIGGLPLQSGAFNERVGNKAVEV